MLAIRPAFPHRLTALSSLRTHTHTRTRTRFSRRAMATTTAESLTADIQAKNSLIQELRKQQADSPALEQARKELGELKKSLALLQGAGSAKDAKDAGKKRERLLLKTPKVRMCAPLCLCPLKLMLASLCL